MAQLRGQPLPEMVHLIQWLEDHIPHSDSDPAVTRISHGDYRHLPCLGHDFPHRHMLAVLCGHQGSALKTFRLLYFPVWFLKPLGSLVAPKSYGSDPIA